MREICRHSAKFAFESLFQATWLSIPLANTHRHADIFTHQFFELRNVTSSVVVGLHERRLEISHGTRGIIDGHGKRQVHAHEGHIDIR